MRICGYPDIRISAYPAIRISGNPDIRISGYPHIRNYRLDLSPSFHPAQSLLRDGSGEKVENFHLGIYSSPLAQLKESHFVWIVPFSVVIASCNCAQNTLAVEVDHLCTSNHMAKSVWTSWRFCDSTGSVGVFAELISSLFFWQKVAFLIQVQWLSLSLIYISDGLWPDWPSSVEVWWRKCWLMSEWIRV